MKGSYPRGARPKLEAYADRLFKRPAAMEIGDDYRGAWSQENSDGRRGI